MNVIYLIETIKKDEELVKKLMEFCDIEIYPNEKKPEDMKGAMIYNIDGIAFACDGSGGEYILLSDNTIGFSSSEGECGRIAENITELFELQLNCSGFMNYLFIDLYKDDELMEKYITKMENDSEKWFNEHKGNYKNMQKELLGKLSIRKYDSLIELLKRFHKTANRDPKYYYTCTEENGNKIESGGCIIDTPLYDRVKKRMGL